MTVERLIQVRAVSKRYGALQALDQVDLTLAAGEMLALLGHNGAGKTTLLKTILGLQTADSGDVSVLSCAPGQANHQIGYVPENVNFYPTLTGRETLMYFARLNGLTKAQARQQSQALLATVNLEAAADRPVKQYSKGMKQRLGLAQALLPSRLGRQALAAPKLLILDEPTVGLDPVATLEFFQLLSELKQQGCGMIICTHVLPGLENYLDRVQILNRGRLVIDGSIDELHQQAHLPVRVTPKGLNGSLRSDLQLQPYLTGSSDLQVPAELTLKVVEHLLQNEQLAQLQVTPPTLPELYQHFIQQDAPAVFKGDAHV